MPVGCSKWTQRTRRNRWKREQESSPQSTKNPNVPNTLSPGQKTFQQVQNSKTFLSDDYESEDDELDTEKQQLDYSSPTRSVDSQEIQQQNDSQDRIEEISNYDIVCRNPHDDIIEEHDPNAICENISSDKITDLQQNSLIRSRTTVWVKKRANFQEQNLSSDSKRKNNKTNLSFTDNVVHDDDWPQTGNSVNYKHSGKWYPTVPNFAQLADEIDENSDDNATANNQKTSAICSTPEIQIGAIKPRNVYMDDDIIQEYTGPDDIIDEFQDENPKDDEGQHQPSLTEKLISTLSQIKEPTCVSIYDIALTPGSSQGSLHSYKETVPALLYADLLPHVPQDSRSQMRETIESRCQIQSKSLSQLSADHQIKQGKQCRLEGQCLSPFVSTQFLEDKFQPVTINDNPESDYSDSKSEKSDSDK